MLEINNNKKRKVFVIHLAVYLHVNRVQLIINKCMKVFINLLHPINNTIHHRISLVVENPTEYFLLQLISFLLASSAPADSVGPNEMNDSTTGTLLSLGKTEFDRRIKKKYVKLINIKTKT